MKTASTSLEIALSEYCGSEDIITSLEIEDEKTRKTFGYRGSQNQLIPLYYYTPFDWAKTIIKRRRRKFRNHMSAHMIKQYVNPHVWESYFKFCFERNPYDKAISRYFYSTRKAKSRPSLVDYLKKESKKELSNWHIYTIKNKVSVDFIGRYEYLEQDLNTITQKVGLPKLSLPKAKSNFRGDRSHYSTTITPDSRELIDKICYREIDYFGYKFNSKN